MEEGERRVANRLKWEYVKGAGVKCVAACRDDEREKERAVTG